jgi:hypothetical protein
VNTLRDAVVTVVVGVLVGPWVVKVVALYARWVLAL